MILIIDNYDSFTFNVFQAISAMTDWIVKVVRNDASGLRDLVKLDISHLVISPGPGRPSGAGITLDAVRAFAGSIPILGVCLGHQAIGEAFGARVIQARCLMHGKLSTIIHGGTGLYGGLPNPFEAVRYHSLALERGSLPDVLEVTSTAQDGEVMGVRHREFNVEGVQFHPESFGSPGGEAVFRNFLEIQGGIRDAA